MYDVIGTKPSRKIYKSNWLRNTKKTKDTPKVVREFVVTFKYGSELSRKYAIIEANGKEDAYYIAKTRWFNDVAKVYIKDDSIMNTARFYGWTPLEE